MVSVTLTLSGTVTLLYLFIDPCAGRGGTGRLDTEAEGEERTYPSAHTAKYYYTYYISYFTPSGFRYAKTNLESLRTRSICTNYEPYFDNGTYLGEFPCPMEKDPDEFTHCCGENGYEYCCKALDSRSIRIGIGFGAAAGLGIIIGTVACIVMKVKRRNDDIRIKGLSTAHMDKKGIPKYDDYKTKNFTASQSIDGYQILVVFKQKKFYQRFYEELRLKYVDISWRYDDKDLVTEGKIELNSESWVNLVLCDDFEGAPVMIVMRERPAVVWMNTMFMEICERVPEERGLLCCCCCNNRTHPCHDSTGHTSPDNSGDTTKLTTNTGGSSRANIHTAEAGAQRY